MQQAVIRRFIADLSSSTVSKPIFGGDIARAITRSLPNANCYDEARTSPNLKFKPEKPVQYLSRFRNQPGARDAKDDPSTRFTPYDDAFAAASRRASSCSRRYAARISSTLASAFRGVGFLRRVVLGQGRVIWAAPSVCSASRDAAPTPATRRRRPGSRTAPRSRRRLHDDRP